MPINLALSNDNEQRQGTILAVRGAPGSGKTQLATEHAAQLLAEDRAVLWVDADRTLRGSQSKLHGALIAHPANVAELTKWLNELLGCRSLAGIIIDSLDALPMENQEKQATHWCWSEEDELFATLRQHARSGVVIVYTEHAQSFAVGHATRIKRLSRQLSTDRRVLAQAYPKKSLSRPPRSHALREQRGRIEGPRYPQS